MTRAVDERHRQRDIVGDAFRAHVVQKREALACGIVEAASDLPPLAEHDRQRVVDEFRRIQDVETGGAHYDLRSLPPNEIATENIGMQGPDENADAPERQACL